MIDYKETPVLFGPDRSLVGIITTPDAEPMAPVACLMLNMGANHRIGPRRINVKLARRMAERGISSIRLDLAGLGDSGTASGSEHFMTQAVHDLQAAMNLVETMLGIRRFIVIGLCSGATNGLSVAVADARVIGLLMFDGYAFPGRRSRFERSVRRALAVPTNPAVIGKAVRWLHRKISSSASAAAAPQIFEPTSPEVTAATFRRSMTQVAERNVAVLFLYTGTMHVTDRNRDQLGDFAREEPFARQFEYRFIADIDHSLTSMASQQTFMEVVCDWASRVAQGGMQQAVLAPAGKTGRSSSSLAGPRSLSPRVQGDTVF
ncbi:MAG: alpha/beta hydrolase [Gammaproteobacteria bacterium]|nr:alpha/beta hydrolase [Gammaproteobacteria bacterium]MBU1439885.1 alpha/beta hydrolase [Gammaproteobacteria bacterium]MBU2285936.1 alpha/beta hydrolase [Gammaproteobacteria bacterium]MBU2407542.1 alpha/beta hydrolase [Gammaproteobacteria bacterium]